MTIPVELAVEGREYDLIYVVCGCPVCCADISGLRSKEFIFVAENGRYIKRTVMTQ
jgi:tRNA(Arg) A34 adenosine deaminase TadA